MQTRLDCKKLNKNLSSFLLFAHFGLVDWNVCFRHWRFSSDNVGGFFGDHDGRPVQVAAYDARHDRGVNNAQAVDA